MKALLYIRLLAAAETIVYENPVLGQIKKQLPDVAALDIDSESDQLVLHYARQLLLGAVQSIVCIDSATPDAGFGSVFPLLELVLQGQKDRLILFKNNHNRLQRMVLARPELNVLVVQDDEELLQVVRGFYS